MSEECKHIFIPIINTAYGDASIIQRLKVFHHLKKCSNCKSLYLEHKIAAEALHVLPEMECPDSIIQKIESRIGERKFEATSFLVDFYSIFTRVSYKTAIVSVVTIAVLVVFAISLRNNNKSNDATKYSTLEVEHANEQAKQALALVGKVLNSTQSRLEKEILTKQVANPLNKSLNAINDLFKSGEKNEKN
ncbi:MAG: hypothetical protein NTX22_07975 [Ignavibacteriales bacterium]|nr:hypothetical protein [Ignavibacteriales bacterium]